MLKKPASGLLASLRGSEVLEDMFRSPRSILRANGHTKCGWYLLASSLTAALLIGLFEHPAWNSLVIPAAQINDVLSSIHGFRAAC
jgi:hypothetical protein